MSDARNVIDLTEDNIQSLAQTEQFTCQFCSIPLHDLSLEQRQAHYESHLTASSSSIPSASLLSKAYKRLTNTRSKGKAPLPEQNVFWFQGQSSAPPKNYTPGLVPTLRRALNKAHAKGLSTRAVLCHEGVTHVALESWDFGWGCGYRNFLMTCTALINQTIQPLYFPLLDDPIPPGVRNLQYWIEDAWAHGFDEDGAEDLRHKLVGTKKWVGTAEIYVAFISRGIPAKLVDFPKSNQGPKTVTKWIMDYFSSPSDKKQSTSAFDALKGANPVTSTDRMPLILQHSGHSRTVVGFEINKKGEPNLLVFDPSYRPSKELRQAALSTHSPIFLSHSPKKNRKTNATCSVIDVNGKDIKHVREGLDHPSLSLDHEVIVVDEDEEIPSKALDPIKVVSFFRLNQSQLGRKDRYQILYFPLDPPLDDDERWSRRVVTSEVVE